MKGNRLLTIGFVILALLFAAAAIFYFTQKTNLLASGHPAIHTKHALVFSGLAVLSLVAASFSRPRHVST